ncbi:MAG: PilZ domain-containing protein [Bdellovibrionales bacterium]|nr:PilZ domain-containing protein [Bdellovibrionales bacterium]NQZ18970.1 PilZ domain-containing protein [Bdellovibrionales bacterium]
MDQISAFFSFSQFEMSGWELLPGLLMLFFLAGGSLHVLKVRRENSPGYREQRNLDERIRLDLPMMIETPTTQSFSVKTYDISLSGAFIPLNDMKRGMNLTSLVGPRSGIKVGDIIDLKLQTGRFSHIQCQGKVVRLGPAGDQSEGIGIKFIELSRRDQKRLQQILNAQRLQMAS